MGGILTGKRSGCLAVIRIEREKMQAGCILSQLGHIPAEGEKFECEGLRFEVIDMDKHRIDKELIIRARHAPIDP